MEDLNFGCIYAMTTAAVPEFYPWQTDVARQWLTERERFAHAWLIHGLSGIGKTNFALAAAAALLCEKPQGAMACGHCVACQWVALGNHPDLRRIRPDAVAALEGAETEPAEMPVASDDTSASGKKTLSKEIRVEQLRQLHTWFNTATHRGGFRVAVIYPAEAMNAIAANALLKVLEEPPSHTVFLLVADAPDRLLPTLVSRCRRLPMSVPARTWCADWLRTQGVDHPDLWLDAAGGAPLKALVASQEQSSACPEWLSQFAQAVLVPGSADVGPTADALEKIPVSVWVDVMQRWFVDLLLAVHAAPARYYRSLEKQTAKIARAAAPQALADTSRWLGQQRALADHPLNAKLLVHTSVQRIMLALAPRQVQ